MTNAGGTTSRTSTRRPRRTCSNRRSRTFGTRAPRASPRSAPARSIPSRRACSSCDPFKIPLLAEGLRARRRLEPHRLLWGAHDATPTSSTSTPSTIAARPSRASTPPRSRREASGIPGVIDPAARGRSQKRRRAAHHRLPRARARHHAGDQQPRGRGFSRLGPAFDRRLKVFKTLGNWRAEHRFYRRDEKGQVVKEERPPHGRHAVSHHLGSEAGEGPARSKDTRIQPDALDERMGY
jgi:hypothetical protein